MPELPEVETTRKGLRATLCGQQLQQVTIRRAALRYPIPSGPLQALCGHTLQDVQRRAKYLLLNFSCGTLLCHLGMSGHLRILPLQQPPQRHDHVDFIFAKYCLRFHDPRRFGCLLWAGDEPLLHPLLAKLGTEPLAKQFDGRYLYQHSRRRRCSIKSLLMDHYFLVGVGNIYANEALFAAGIRPRRAAQRLQKGECERLVEALKTILRRALQAGGSTLRDFRNSAGKPGYFSLQLAVYGRQGMPCPRCCSTIKRIVQQQRSSFYCPRCQC